jgi:hypothetical protein
VIFPSSAIEALRHGPGCVIRFGPEVANVDGLLVSAASFLGKLMFGGGMLAVLVASLGIGRLRPADRELQLKLAGWLNLPAPDDATLERDRARARRMLEISLAVMFAGMLMLFWAIGQRG